MFDVLTTIFDSIFPPRDDTLRVRRLTLDVLSRLLSPTSIAGIHALLPYTHPDIRALMHEAKFYGNTRAWELLNVLFIMYQNEYLSREIDSVIPIPLSPARLRMRGYNQVTSILTAGKKPLAYTLDTTVLKRVRHTQPQTDLARAERLTNIQGAFVVSDPARITGKHILLVDDVVTTGATLQSAKYALIPHHPASVTCIAFAH